MKRLGGGGPRAPASWIFSADAGALRLVPARGFRARLCGLHAWASWGDEPCGLLLPRCRAVHTFGLTQAIDAVFLSACGRILTQRRLAPNRIGLCLQARAVLELPAGYCSRSDWRTAVNRALSDRKILV